MSAPVRTQISTQIDRRGVVCALIAFGTWGFSALFFKALHGLGAVEIVAHRILWSVLLLTLWVGYRQGFGTFVRTLRQPRLLALLLLTALLASSNWLIYVWAVLAGHAVDASLGYFINPLVNVGLGALFLQERLRRVQCFAVALAALGVMIRVWALGDIPWVALSLAITFGVYGLLRKRAPIDAINGLFIETMMTAPLAVGFLVWSAMQGTMDLMHASATVLMLLPFAGVLTTVPLALFTEGARRLPLSVIGLFQYLAPSITFFLALWVFHEPFDQLSFVSFGFIWAGLAVFSWDLLRRSRRRA